MTAEFGKYWEQIEAIRRKMEEEEEAVTQEAAQILAEETRRKQELTTKAKAILVGIFEEIRQNHPDVKGAAESQLDYPEEEEYNWVSLKWGNRIIPNPQDIWISGAYRIKKDSISEEEIPEAMVMFDHYYIEAIVSPVEVGIVYKYISAPRTPGGKIAITDTYGLAEFVENPAIALPSIVRALREPHHHYRELRKGVDYWLDPRK